MCLVSILFPLLLQGKTAHLSWFVWNQDHSVFLISDIINSNLWTLGINITNRTDKPHTRHLPNVSQHLQIPPTCHGATKVEPLLKGKAGWEPSGTPRWESRTSPSTCPGEQGKLKGPPGAGHGQSSGGHLRGGWASWIRPVSAPQGPDAAPA